MAEEIAVVQQETILIAEDSTANRKILALLLEKAGYFVISCEDGKEAWEALQSTTENVVAVISDVMMPNMDGLQLLKQVRANEKFKDLPFVLITAVSERDHIIQAKGLRVNGYILKPVTFPRVVDKLKELFPSKIFNMAG